MYKANRKSKRAKVAIRKKEAVAMHRFIMATKGKNR
jgi:hypothetical protein